MKSGIRQITSPQKQNLREQEIEAFLSPFLRRQRMMAALPWMQGRVLDFGCDFSLHSLFTAKTGLSISLYRKFLPGANQLFILETCATPRPAQER